MGILQLLAPYGAGIITAIFTVGLTLFATQRKQRLDLQRAIQSELETNRQIAEENIEWMREEIVRREDEGFQILRPLRRFHTDSFEQMKNQGGLMQLPERDRGLLLTHYDFIYELNRLLEFRDTNKTRLEDSSGGGLLSKIFGEEDDLVKDFNLYIIAYLYAVHPSEVDGQIKQEWVEEMFSDADVNSFKQALEVGSSDYLEIPFNEIEELVKRNINSQHVLSRLL